MNLKIKNEWINSGIYCPIRKNEIKVRFMEKELYEYYFNNGYSFLFDIVMPSKPAQKLTNNTDNDLSNDGN